jgi:lysophospholipase L1-like esterase
LLREQGIEIAEPHIIARTAWTADELSDAIDQENPPGTFDLVTLMVGVNDQYRARPVDGFLPEFGRLLSRARRFAGNRWSRVIAVSIPDWGASPFAAGRDRALISAQISEYNARARNQTESSGAQWVDVTEISRQMLTEPVLVASDGLHPSGEMYRRWAHLIFPVALQALATTRRKRR